MYISYLVGHLLPSNPSIKCLHTLPFRIYDRHMYASEKCLTVCVLVLSAIDAAFESGFASTSSAGTLLKIAALQFSAY